jgi:hypothetical protein
MGTSERWAKAHLWNEVWAQLPEELELLVTRGFWRPRVLAVQDVYWV